MGRAIDSFVNGAGKKEIAACAVHITGFVHRTLQQKIMGLFLACVEQWAAQLESGDYDARNEATVRMAKKIVDATGDKYDRQLPYI